MATFFDRTEATTWAGAAIIIAVMLVAIAQIHAPKGVWISEGGFEYNLVLIANMLMFGMGGPGALAVDNNVTYPMTLQAIFALALAVTLLSSDIGKLYEVWLRTREEWVEKKLKAAGLIVDPTKGLQ